MSIPILPFKLRCEVLANEYYRKVFYTDDSLQIVLMCLQAGEYIESEIHEETTQLFRVECGHLLAIVNGVEIDLEQNDLLIIPKGTEHEIINNSQNKVKMYTVYSGVILHPSNYEEWGQPEKED